MIELPTVSTRVRLGSHVDPIGVRVQCLVVQGCSGFRHSWFRAQGFQELRVFWVWGLCVCGSGVQVLDVQGLGVWSFRGSWFRVWCLGEQSLLVQVLGVQGWWVSGSVFYEVQGCSGFRVYGVRGSGLRVWGLGCQGLVGQGLWVQSFWFRVYGFRVLGVWDQVLGVLMLQGLGVQGFRCHVLKFRVSFQRFIIQL